MLITILPLSGCLGVQVIMWTGARCCLLRVRLNNSFVTKQKALFIVSIIFNSFVVVLAEGGLIQCNLSAVKQSSPVFHRHGTRCITFPTVAAIFWQPA